MFNFKNILLLIALIGFSVPAASLAAPDTAQKKEMEQIKKKLSAKKKAAAKAAQKERKTTRELSKLRAKLVRATGELQDKLSEQQNLESRLDELVKETGERGKVLRDSRRRLAKMTSSLLQLSRKPPGMLLLHEDSADAHVHRTVLLRSMLPRLRKETAKILKEIDIFKELQGQTSSQKEVVDAARKNLQRQRHSLDQLVKVRQGLLKKTKAERKAIAQQLERLASEAKDLQQLMAHVSKPSWQRKIAGDVPTLKKLKSGLKMPVAGKVIRRYGDLDEFGVVSEGLLIGGSYGAPVVAPQSGRVVFKGPFRGYGKIVILQHPGGYHSFLSGFSRIDTDMGQQVDAGEPLGILHPKGGGKAQIYFEWRKGTQPVNPAKKL